MSDSPESERPQQQPDRPRPPGRLRAAWLVLRGHRLVDLQIQVEWIEYRQIFDDLLKRFGAQLARQAKAEKKRLERQLQEDDHLAAPVAPAPPSSSRRHPKADLYDRAREAQGSESSRVNRLAQLYGHPTHPSLSPSPSPLPLPPSSSEPQQSLDLNGHHPT